jgi:transcription elongation factor Elf1
MGTYKKVKTIIWKCPDCKKPIKVTLTFLHPVKSSCKIFIPKCECGCQMDTNFKKLSDDCNKYSQSSY